MTAVVFYTRKQKKYFTKVNQEKENSTQNTYTGWGLQIVAQPFITQKQT